MVVGRGGSTKSANIGEFEIQDLHSGGDSVPGTPPLSVQGQSETRKTRRMSSYQLYTFIKCKHFSHRLLIMARLGGSGTRLRHARLRLDCLPCHCLLT